MKNFLTNQSLIVVANWKMNRPHHDAVAYAKELQKLVVHETQVVVCPSFVSLISCADLFSQTSIALGAQTCSSYQEGPYTGQVDAQSLVQVGCTYAIVGHAEQRALTGETFCETGKKAACLIDCHIVPIICIGERVKGRDQSQTIALLQSQLEEVRQGMGDRTIRSKIFIAYEPVWAIGLGVTPDTEILNVILMALKARASILMPDAHIYLLYGGSVTLESAKTLLSIREIDGFLLGGASLDFQKLQNIVSLKKR